MLPNCGHNGATTVPGASLRTLGDVLAAWRSPGGLLERFLEPLGSLLQLSGSLLERSCSQIGASITSLRGPKAFKFEPKRDPNRAPKASRAEKCKITKIAHSTKDLNEF